ncbi:MAG: type III secretion system export apparatus subunit SctV [Exilibacterium sp.]
MNHVFDILNRIAILAMKRSEIVGAIFVLAIVFMMVMPLPTDVVDVLIAINICISSLFIVLSMYLPGPLAFSSFPAVLLLTTLFRLALSISTTRLILLNQDAGNIVEAFGNFTVGGNLAVGLVVFLILTVVNFLVITKGSERVAEVAARFTLDAMPGKQMSIDSDLRAGLIDANMARFRREQLTKESQLFGAMDGAMKFVKGDAIAGLVIVAINLIGGFSVGTLQHDMSAGESIELYAVLTVGDGLIAQIPALLISITAGMIITRVSSNDDTGTANIGKEMAEQITSQPRAWIIASIGMFAYGLLPGMPTTIFIIISVITLVSGIFQMIKARTLEEAGLDNQKNNQMSPEENGEEDIRQFNPSKPFVLQFNPQCKNQVEATELVKDIRRCRNRLVAQYGLTLPSFNLEFVESLSEDEFRFCIYEVPMLIATFNSDLVAVEKNGLAENIAAQGTPGSEQRREDHWIWFAANHPVLKDETLHKATARELILINIERTLFSAGPQFLGLQETKTILGWLESELPELAQELQRVIPTTLFSSVLQRLASERISLRTIRPIVEALIEHGQYERDVGALTDFVRIALKDQIYHQFKDDTGLNVWLLTPETEELLRDSLRQTQTDAFFALDQHMHQSLFEKLRDAFIGLSSNRQILLVAQDLRRILRGFIRDEFDHVPVLSFSELQSTSQLNVVGRISLES